MRKINTRSFVRATRATPREVNRQILLNLVREHEPISRADLARRMEIARGMVTSLVDELIADGSLYEGATIDSPRGRRPQMLFVRTRGRLVDLRRRPLQPHLRDARRLQRSQRSRTETFDTIEDPNALVARAQVARASGCSRPLRRRPVRGDRARRAGHGGQRYRPRAERPAPWLAQRGHPRPALGGGVGLPVFVENAPIACALAQMWLGQRGGTQLSDFVYVSVSDGVGTGVVVNGQVLRGKRNTAGEFGHVPLSADGPDCHCGGRGCLESYTSNLATVLRYLGQDFSPRDGARDRRSLGPDDRRRDRARARRRRACPLDDHETARHLGAGLAVIMNTLSPAADLRRRRDRGRHGTSWSRPSAR